jgi:O-6-methylguanine DNA methyltransferase
MNNDMRVYEFLQSIPKGKVVTYGQIAAFLGNKNLARAVGKILHRNPDGDLYPCYKVVNAKGMLSPNYCFGGTEEQARRLELEGIKVKDNRVDMDIYKYNF